MADDRAEYERLRRALSGESLPCALIDLDAFDRNADRTFSLVRARRKSLRIATKSIRSPLLLRRLLDRGADVCRGLMCFAAREAAWLAGEGFDDLLVAYPTVLRADLEALAKASAAGKQMSLVVDSVAHLDALARAGREFATTMKAVVELDVAYRAFGIHLGVRRSPLRTPEDVVALLEAARGLDGVTVRGVMGYEAHVAGLTDANPFTSAQNPLKRLFKRLAAPAAADLRARTLALARKRGFEVALVNGGGTGSLGTTAAEDAVTEVTAGSAFFASQLFDYYRGLDLRPAAFFACQVVRSSDEGFVTCHGGGWVASGEAGPDRLPRPWLPAGLELVPVEGAGEVQTPLVTRGASVSLEPGDPVFFRHAKAGELAEHVNEFLLVEGDRVTGRAPTYRGLGKAFL
jgi:D-serine deaminase-like pyridoxal phosphate-dependent protein